MKNPDEVKELAEKEYPIGKKFNPNFVGFADREQAAYIKGYTQCQEDSADKKYTEEDIRKAVVMASTSNTDFIPDRCEEIIQSLNK